MPSLRSVVLRSSRGVLAAALLVASLAMVPAQPLAGQETVPPEPLLTPVSGHVVDADGQPVRGVIVEVSGISSRTDESGWFRARSAVAGDLKLRVNAPGYLPAELPVHLVAGEELSGLRMVLEPAPPVTVRVAGPDGEPLPDATVGIWPTVHQTKVSGSGGVFRAAVLPGTVTILVEHPDLLDAQRELHAERGGAYDLRVTLERGGEVHGRVVDREGRPLIARVDLVAPRGAPTGYLMTRSTGEDGRFRLLGVAPGRHRIHAVRQGFRPGFSEPFEIVAEGGAARVEVVLEEGAVITGRVLGMEKEDLADVSVDAQRLDPVMPGPGSFSNGSVAEDGTYRLEALSPGSWRIKASLRRGEALAADTVLVPPGAREVYRDIRFGTGHALTGRVTIDGRLPRVALVGAISRDGSVGDEVDEAGRFEIRGLPEGRYLLQVQGAGVATGVLRETRQVEVTGDTEIEVEILSGALEGRVTGATGAPVPGAEVTAVRLDSIGLHHDWSGKTDDTGSYRFDSLVAGRYLVQARADGQTTAADEAVVPAGAVARADLRLPEGAELEVLLTTADGPYEGSARMHAFPAAALAAAVPQPVPAFARQDVAGGGRARLLLPPGRWIVVVHGDGTVAEVEARVPGPAVVARLQVPGSLHVRVPELAGSREEGRLLLRRPDGRLLVRSVAEGLAAPGYPYQDFAALDVPPGAWTVTVTAEDGRTWTDQILVEPGGWTETVLE